MVEFPCQDPARGAKKPAFFMHIEDLSIDLIDIYGGTQTRLNTNDDAISSYAEEMANGAEFPPVVVFYDGSRYWLADGFHRYLAVKRNEKSMIRAEVRPGGRSDALAFALGANATNGIYRSSADKRNAAEIALEEWPEKANTVIAELCKVSVELVRRTRIELTKLDRIEQPKTVTGKDGKQYPAAIERQPRGQTERSSSDSAGGGGGGGKGKKGKGEFLAPGGSNREIEAEARAMIRRGEINPFELETLSSATAHDYAETVINLLKRMNPADPKRPEALARIQRWVDGALRGEIEEHSIEPEIEEALPDSVLSEDVDSVVAEDSETDLPADQGQDAGESAQSEVKTS